jgi:hypothetical protein
MLALLLNWMKRCIGSYKETQFMWSYFDRKVTRFSSTNTVSSYPMTNHWTSRRPSLNVFEIILDTRSVEQWPCLFLYFKWDVVLEILRGSKARSVLLSFLLDLPFSSSHTKPLVCVDLHHSILIHHATTISFQ